MHADRTNRFMLTVFGLLLVAAGGAAMAASVGVFGTSYSHLNLFENKVSGYFSHHGGWLWPAIAVGCVLIGLACLRWLLALLASTDRSGDITVSDGNTEEGTTILRPQALIDALTTEVAAYRGVDSASGRVIGDGRDPEIVLNVTTTSTADLQALHHRIEAEALTHARHATGKPDLPVQLNLA